MVDKRRLCQKGVPFSGFRNIFVYERVGISLAEVFQKVGKSVILTYKKNRKGLQRSVKLIRYTKGIPFVNKR